MYKIRSTLTKFFGWIAFISIALIILCVSMLSYVGVKIQDILVPLTLISTILWWLIHLDKNNTNEK